MVRKGRFAAVLGLLGVLSVLPVWAAPQAFVEHIIDADLPGASAVHAADLDGDGDMDVVVATQARQFVAWWENDGGSPPGWTEHRIDSGVNTIYRVYAVDVDGDLDTDILASHGVGIAWWENDGGNPPSWSRHEVDTERRGWRCAYTADIEGDGDVDVLGSGLDLLGRIAWWESAPGLGLPGSSPIAWTRHMITEGLYHTSWVHASDLDGDGDVDVLADVDIDRRVGGIFWWENEPSGNPAPADPVDWTKHTIDDDFTRGMCLHAADIDGDGDTDVVAGGYRQHITWWENLGGAPPGFVKHVFREGQTGYWFSVYAADVDDDGDTDVLGAEPWADNIVWHENVGGTPPLFQGRLVTGDFDTVLSIHAADLDGDCDTDVLGAAGSAHALRWWENLQGFALSSHDALRAIVAGDSAEFELSTSSRNGFARSIELFVSNLPPGASATFSANPVFPGGTAVMAVVTEPSTPAGIYSLEITGSAVYESGCSRSESAVVSLEVVAAQTETVPEPGTAVMLSGGLAGLLSYVAFRRRGK